MSGTDAYRVLVVEDEPPILHNVVHKVEALDLPLRVVGAAMDGETALDLVRQEHPHIVITDIRMPGMDGLELCRRLFEEYPDIKTVVLSGYGEFEYARTAIRYQVADYLLKPLNTGKLRETMEKLCGELDRSRDATRRQHLERQLAGGTDGRELPFQFEGERFDLCLICLGNLLDNDDGAEAAARCRACWDLAGLDRFLAGEQLLCWWLIEEKTSNERMLLTVGGTQNLAERLHRHLCGCFGDACCVNLCHTADPVGFAEIWNTARQLRAALRRQLAPCRSRLFSPDAESRPKVSGGAWLSLAQAIRSGSPAQLRGTLHTYLAEQREKQAPQVALETAVKELLHAILEQRREAGQPSSEWYSDCGRVIVSAAEEGALYAKLEELLCAAYVESTVGALPPEQLALAVKRHLEDNYRQEITMESLSRKFYFSESYITRLFRGQFGTPPVKYLLRLRMERAKELIAADPNISFGAVARMVGYEDQHYFSRLFRISTGMSPSEYKDSLK